MRASVLLALAATSITVAEPLPQQGWSEQEVVTEAQKTTKSRDHSSSHDSSTTLSTRSSRYYSSTTKKLSSSTTLNCEPTVVTVSPKDQKRAIFFSTTRAAVVTTIYPEGCPVPSSATSSKTTSSSTQNCEPTVIDLGDLEKRLVVALGSTTASAQRFQTVYAPVCPVPSSTTTTIKTSTTTLTSSTSTTTSSITTTSSTTSSTTTPSSSTTTTTPPGPIVTDQAFAIQAQVAQPPGRRLARRVSTYLGWNTQSLQMGYDTTSAAIFAVDADGNLKTTIGSNTYQVGTTSSASGSLLQYLDTSQPSNTLATSGLWSIDATGLHYQGATFCIDTNDKVRLVLDGSPIVSCAAMTMTLDPNCPACLNGNSDQTVLPKSTTTPIPTPCSTTVPTCNPSPAETRYRPASSPEYIVGCGMQPNFWAKIVFAESFDACLKMCTDSTNAQGNWNCPAIYWESGADKCSGRRNCHLLANTTEAIQVKVAAAVGDVGAWRVGVLTKS